MCYMLALLWKLYNVILFMCELLGLEMLNCWEIYGRLVRLGLAYLFFFFSFLRCESDRRRPGGGGRFG